jgi:hypothetical protein
MYDYIQVVPFVKCLLLKELKREGEQFVAAGGDFFVYMFVCIYVYIYMSLYIHKYTLCVCMYIDTTYYDCYVLIHFGLVGRPLSQPSRMYIFI